MSGDYDRHASVWKTPAHEVRPVRRWWVLLGRRLRRRVDEKVTARDDRELAVWDRMRESRQRLQGLLDAALGEAMLLEDLTGEFAPHPTLATRLRESVARAQYQCRAIKDNRCWLTWKGRRTDEDRWD